MNEFETTLADALLDEAREIAMATDKNHATLELEARLDHADRARRRHLALGAVAVAAAAVAVVAVVVGHIGSGPAPQPPATPSPEPSQTTFTSKGFAVPLSLTLPSYLSASRAGVQPHADPRALVWEQSSCSLPATPCAEGADLKLRIVAPVAVYRPVDTPLAMPMPDYKDYATYLRTLQSDGVTEADEVSTTVGGRPATEMTLIPSGALYGAIGCVNQFDAAKDCWGFPQNGDAQTGYALRFAVVDTSGGPLLVWLRFNVANPNRADALAQFDRMLATVTFAPGTGPSSS